MKKQRLDEWMTDINKDYYDKQYKTPYRSTIKFCDWLEELNILTKLSEQNIIDMGSGTGANLYYLNQRFPKCYFSGIDINPNFVKEGNEFFKEHEINNCKLISGDIYNLDTKIINTAYNGILSFQTFSWLPEYEKALSEIIKIDPKWIAFTSLFYDGLVDCKIEVKEYLEPNSFENPKESFYNIYSLPKIKNFFSRCGFNKFDYLLFEIDTDLPRPSHTFMQTYTETLATGKRIQMSGPIRMNWYFVIAIKE